MTRERGKALITDKIARRDLLTPMVLMTRRITRFRVFTPITLDNSLLIFVCIREIWKNIFASIRSRGTIRIIILYRMYFNLLERRNHAQLASPSPFYTPSELFSDRLAPMFGGSAVKVGAVPVILVVNVGHIAVNHEKKN